MKKRLISLLLTLMMIASFAVPVSAENVTLKVLAGKNQSNAGKYGSLDVYASMGYSLEVINEAATYTWAHSGDTTKMTDGWNVWFPGVWGNQLWLSNGTPTNYTITFDLGSVFNVDRVDIFSLAHNANNYVSAATVKVGETNDSASMVTATSTLNRVQSTVEGLTDCVDYVCTLEKALKGRYVEVTLTARDAPVSEIMVFGDEYVDTGIYTYYSVTGYDIPAYIQNLYAGKAEFAASTATVNNLKKTRATITSVTNIGSWLGEVPTEKFLNGTYVGDAASCVQLEWQAGSVVTMDLGKVQNVDRISVFSRGTDSNISGNINSIKVQKSDSGEDGTWTDVQTATGSTEPVYKSDATTNYLHDVKLDTTLSTRYLRLVVSYYNAICLGQICVMSKTVQPAGDISWSGRPLTLLSDNTSVFTFIPDVKGLQTVATGAKYKYVTTDYTEGDSQPDAEGWFSSTKADLKDGYCGDGNGETQTQNWDKSNMVVIWDLGSKFAFDRLDIVSDAANDGAGYGWLGTTKIYVSDSEAGPWTEICNVSTSELVDAYVDTNGKKTTDTIFDLQGAEGRYLKIDMYGKAHQLVLAEMYIFGEPGKSATTPVFVDNDGNNYDTTQSTSLNATTTFTGCEGTLIVAWYNSSDVLKKIYVTSGTGAVSINVPQEDENAFLDEKGDKMKAFAFESVSNLNSLGSAVAELNNLGE